jgi:hypothetical protein
MVWLFLIFLRRFIYSLLKFIRNRWLFIFFLIMRRLIWFRFFVFLVRVLRDLGLLNLCKCNEYLELTIYLLEIEKYITLLELKTVVKRNQIYLKNLAQKLKNLLSWVHLLLTVLQKNVHKIDHDVVNYSIFV